MNCLTEFPYRKSFYFAHPLRFLRQLWRNLKNAHMRATQGVADYDVAEMDEFLLRIIPVMLRKLADGDSYPANDEFPTYESWQEWCHNLAAQFEQAQEKNWYGRNEFADDWHNACRYRVPHPNLTMTSTLTDEQYEDLRQKFWNREVELVKERDTLIQEAYSTLAKYHTYLWL